MTQTQQSDWKLGSSIINEFEKTNIPVMERRRFVGKKLVVDALLPMLYRLRFSKSFQSDNNVYCDLNNSTLDFRLFYLALSKSFLNFKIVLVVIEKLLYGVIHQVDY